MKISLGINQCKSYIWFMKHHCECTPSLENLNAWIVHSLAVEYIHWDALSLTSPIFSSTFPHLISLSTIFLVTASSPYLITPLPSLFLSLFLFFLPLLCLWLLPFFSINCLLGSFFSLYLISGRSLVYAVFLFFLLSLMCLSLWWRFIMTGHWWNIWSLQSRGVRYAKS